MITKRYTATISIKAPEWIETFYKEKAKKRIKEMDLNIPPELVLLVLKAKKRYKGGLINISMEDAEIINKLAEEYGITKGDALLSVLVYNFPEAKNLLIKEETNNGKEKTKK
jgi:hypothetical protein